MLSELSERSLSALWMLYGPFGCSLASCNALGRLSDLSDALWMPSECSLSSPLLSSALLRAQLCCLSELPLWCPSKRTTFWRGFSTIPLRKPRILLSQGRSQTLLRPPSGAPLLTSALLKAQLEAQLCCLSELPLWCHFLASFLNHSVVQTSNLALPGQVSNSPAPPLWSSSAHLCSAQSAARGSALLSE